VNVDPDPNDSNVVVAKRLAEEFITSHNDYVSNTDDMDNFLKLCGRPFDELDFYRTLVEQREEVLVDIYLQTVSQKNINWRAQRQVFTNYLLVQ